MNSVDVLTTQEQVQFVDTFISKHYSQDIHDSWRVGLQFGLRISDLVSIRFNSFRMSGDKWVVEITEGKTDKPKLITLNSVALEVLERRRTTFPNDVFLFQSKNRAVKNKCQPISRSSVWEAISEAGKPMNLRLGTHSMRKTRAYRIYKKTNDIALVMHLLNHRSAGETLRYLGITQTRVQETYDLEII